MNLTVWWRNDAGELKVSELKHVVAFATLHDSANKDGDFYTRFRMCPYQERDEGVTFAMIPRVEGILSK